MKLNTISLNRVFYSYEHYQVLRGTSLTVHTGEIHAVVGEHGAGKSTIAHILSGFYQPRKGQVQIDGVPVIRYSRKTAWDRGIYYVSQHNPLIEGFTVWENIILDDRITPFSLQTRRQQLCKVRRFMASLEVSFQIDICQPLHKLGLSDLVLVDILKALYKEPSLLIIDEALEKLNADSLKKMHELLYKRKNRGLGILFITHRIDDIFFFADKVSIIRDGGVFATEEVDKIDRIALIKLAYTQVTDSFQKLTRRSFTELLKFNETILNDLPVNLILVSTSGEIKLINRQAMKLFPRNVASEIPTLADLLGDENMDFLEALRIPLGEQQERRLYSLRLEVQGKTTLNNITLFPVKEGTRHIGTILIIEDITNYEEMRNRIQLSENLASVGLLASGVAHEINNPLEIIHYYLESIRFYNRDQAISEYVASISEEIGDISRILENLVALSPRKENPGMTEFDLGQTIRDIRKLIHFEARKRNIEILLDIPDEEIVIRADRLEIKQLLLNLIRNSFEAIDKYGTIDICLTRNPADQKAILRVSDSGPGIREDELKSIFLPFFSSKRGGSNLGMGLSICHSIVENHKGVIQAANSPGKGLCLTVTIPSARIET